MITKHIMSLTSGGLDSIVGLYYLKSLGHSVHVLIIEYGQKHVQETIWSKHHASRLGCLFSTICIPQLEGSSLTDGSGGVVVKGRNAIFLSLAVHKAAVAGADTVTYFPNADDEAMFPDCRTCFLDSYNAMLKASEINIEVCAPFITWAKWQIGDLGRQLGVNFNETWSCYKGGKEPCGECLACKTRERAMDLMPVVVS